VSPQGVTWTVWGHPWNDTMTEPRGFIERSRGGLWSYEYLVEQEPYTGLPKDGYEQGYSLPHWSDREAA
jgi:hypothetical protein